MTKFPKLLVAATACAYLLGAPRSAPAQTSHLKCYGVSEQNGSGFCTAAGAPLACCTGKGTGTCVAPGAFKVNVNLLTLTQCNGGANNGFVCTSDSDCPGGRCQNFSEAGCTISGPPQRVCEAVLKQVTGAPTPPKPGSGPTLGPTERTHRFLCYAVHCPSTTSPLLTAEDQFGTHALKRSSSPERLCTPADATTTSTTLPGQTCQTDAECGVGQFCECPPGTCSKTGGTCVNKPDFCPAVVLPVCGCDGTTYVNACVSRIAGACLLHDGACF